MEAGAAGANNFEDPTLNSKPWKPIAETTPRERIAGGVAAIAIVTSLLAMIFEEFAGIVVISGILTSVAGPYAYYQQTCLTDIRTLQEPQEAVKREVDRLEEENARLKQSVEDLKATVTRLEDVKQALDAITAMQGKCMDAFAKQVEENKDILAQMQCNLQSNVLQNILNVILRSDVEHDYKIDEEEIYNIIKRIENINGVEVADERSRVVVREAGGNIVCPHSSVPRAYPEATTTCHLNKQQLYTQVYSETMVQQNRRAVFHASLVISVPRL